MIQDLREQTEVKNQQTYSYQCVEHLQDVISTIEVAAAQMSQFALVSTTLYFAGRERTSAEAEQSACYFLEQIRPLTRKTDIVLLHRYTSYFILPGANLQGGQIVQERLWEALLWRAHNTEAEQVLHPWSLAIGHSAYPEPHHDIQACVTAAHEVRHSFQLTPQEFSPARKETPETDLPILARRLGVPYLSFLPRKLPARLKQLITPQLAQELHCYPLGCERNTLTVAMTNPRDRQAITRLNEITGMRIFPVLVHPQALEMALAQL